VIVEDVPFEVEQEQTFEEVEPQFLREEGKWISSPCILFFVLITNILSHFRFYNLLCINFDGKCLLRNRLVLIPIPCIPCFK
jgi:hypothetical protein